MIARLRRWDWANWLAVQIWTLSFAVAAFLVTLTVGTLAMRAGAEHSAPGSAVVDTWRKATPEESRAWEIANENAIRWAELNSGVQSEDVR